MRRVLFTLGITLAMCAESNCDGVSDLSRPSYEHYLRGVAVPRSVLDVFLDPEQPSWARFDPVLGYRLGNSMPTDGLDGARTISTVEETGARRSWMYAEQPCRINTYGDSFTQCHQVSDGETWQEYLAAHFGEPIRNFGMGGYGTYQAYLRLLSVEQSPLDAKNVILFLWGDDHLRSIMRCRYALIQTFWDSQGGLAFHNNFWANIEMDLDTGNWVEHENLLPTPESLYKMADPEFMVQALRDDLMLQMCLAPNVDPFSLDLSDLDRLAAHLGLPPVDRTSAASIEASCDRMKHAYGFAATQLVLERTAAFCRAHEKNLLILLLCPKATNQLLRGEPRYDQSLVNSLHAGGYRYFDMNVRHLDDFADFKITRQAYLKRYFIGHYSPAGNHFLAYSIKDAVLEMLDPKPITYRTEGSATDFTEYLKSSGTN